MARQGGANGVVTVVVGSTGPVPRAVLCSMRKADRVLGCPGTEPGISRGKFNRADSQTRATRPPARVAVSGRSVSGPLSVLEVPVTGIASGDLVRALARRGQARGRNLHRGCPHGGNTQNPAIDLSKTPPTAPKRLHRTE